MGEHKISPPPDDTVRLVASLIAHETSHAFTKHHLKFNEFNNPDFGSPLNIRSCQDLVQHAVQILADPDTKTVHTQGRTIYAYHEKTETVVILNSDGLQNKDGGTVYRRWPKEARNDATWYARLVSRQTEIAGVAGFPERKGGLLRLLQENPQLAQEIHEKYEQLLKKKELRTIREEITFRFQNMPLLLGHTSPNASEQAILQR